MTVKSFGTVLIGTGIFLIFTFFVFSSWTPSYDFMSNIRWAILLEVGGSDTYPKAEPLRIRLGQGLLLPFFVIGIGFVIRLKIVSSDAIIKMLPFLTKDRN